VICVGIAEGTDAGAVAGAFVMSATGAQAAMKIAMYMNRVISCNSFFVMIVSIFCSQVNFMAVRGERQCALYRSHIFRGIPYIEHVSDALPPQRVPQVKEPDEGNRY